MTPEFQILANGEDVTQLISDRLLSLNVVDEDGVLADRMLLTLDNRDKRLELPNTKMPLDVSLGFRGRSLSYIGKYTVDRLSGSGPKLEMVIGATAANMTGSIRAPKTRAWNDVSLPDIVSKIASENGLNPIVGKSLQSVQYPYIAQTSESDLHFLTRLSQNIDATAKPIAGNLLVQRRGEGLNAEGQKLEPVKIDVGVMSEFSWDQVDREAYKQVEAEWGDLDAGERKKVTVGSGEPVRRLRHVYPTAEEAQRAALADLALSGRAVITGEFQLASFNAALFAGGQSELSGLQSEIDGVWHVERVEHNLKDSLKTKFRARIART